MSQITLPSRRPTSSALRLQIIFACALSVVALSAIYGGVRAQQAAPPSQGTQLPPVPVEPPVQAQPKQVPAPKQAAPAPQPKAATVPKRVAAPKVQPKQAPAQVPVAADPPPPASPANALGTYNPALDLRNVTLPPGTTVTTAGPVQGYRALSAMSSTKTATPIEQIPQSIQVVPRSVLNDQRNLTTSEALQNVSNTQGSANLNIGNTDMQQMKIRGFPAEKWLDGLPLTYDSGDKDSLVNIERIEVLKGPSAILYGGGTGAPIGGAVNFVSKLPTNVASGEFGVTVGSHRYVTPYFDMNQPLNANGTVLFRATGEYSSAKSFVDVLESERYSFNPTLTFTNKTDTTLTLQARLSRFEQQAYPGLPAVGTVAGGFRINRNMFAGDQNIVPSRSEVQSLTATLDHKVNSIWSFNVKTRVSRSEFEQNSQGPSTAAPDVGTSTWSLLNTEVAQKQTEFSINPNLLGRFAYGPTWNTFLVGADYSRVTDKGHMTVDAGVFPVDLLAPAFLSPYSDPNPASPFYFPFFDFNGVFTTKGAYAQMQSSIHDRVHLLAGARLANINVEYFEKVPFSGGGFFPPETFTMEKTKVLPRAGIVVDVVKGFSLFTSYSEGMKWTGFTQARELAPEESKQVEAGIKYNIGNQLSGTVAVFEIRRSNVPVVVAAGVSNYSQQQGRGFETDLVWQPVRHFKVLANYGHTIAEYSDSLLGAPKGNRIAGVPEHSGRLWVDYGLEPHGLRGWSVGAGVYMASEQFVDIANLYKTGGFYTLDAKVAYENDRYKAAFHAKNLTGQEYFMPYSWFGGQVAPGDARAFYGTFALKY
ncbi:MAG: TonB-dependent siderophore receptor [Hyphomicrobiaceae bacterium]